LELKLKFNLSARLYLVGCVGKYLVLSYEYMQVNKSMHVHKVKLMEHRVNVN